jgi:peptide/nickel transport system ATP-binding protein
VNAGETLCIVGESGCGKSVTALSILRLVPSAAGRIVARARRSCSTARICEAQRRRDAQDPRQPHLDDLPGADDLAQPRAHHRQADRRDRHAAPAASAAEAMATARTEMLRLVQIPDAEPPARRVPAPALGRHAPARDDRDGAGLPPALLIADEPTTALDVTIQAQILDLLRNLQEALGTARDPDHARPGRGRRNADRVVVMYAGARSRRAGVEIFDRPLHPYTRG